MQPAFTLGVARERPVRKSAQRLRWFVAAFEDCTARAEAETGHRFAVDREALTRVFAAWLADFQAQKPAREDDKPAYVGFAAGLMLRALVTGTPVRVERRAPGDAAVPSRFWPEGHLYVAFCLEVRGLVMSADFDGTQRLAPALDDLRTWWSFRENVGEDPSRAIGFLDLFAGEDPDWTAPQLFRPGRAGAIAAPGGPRHIQPVD